MPNRASHATRAIGAAFAAVLAFLAVPESARAQTDAQALPTVRPSIAIEPQNGAAELAYEIFFGGARIGVLDGRATVDERGYELTFRFRTDGVLAWAVEGRSVARAIGLVSADGGFTPRLYETSGTWNGSHRSVALEFGAAGQIERISTKQDKPEERDAVPEDKRVGLDPITLLMSVARNPQTDGTWQERATFDGRRVVTYRWRCGERSELKPTSTSAFAGEAVLCIVSGRQTAGFHRSARRIFDFDKPGRLWLAPVRGLGVHMPVRLVMDTEWGGLMVYATRTGRAPDM